MSALRLINETSISTPVNKIEITDVFTTDYDIYCVEVVGTTCSSQRENNSMDMRLINSSGSEVSSSVYSNEARFFRGFSDASFDLGSASRDDFIIVYHDTSAQDGVGNMKMWIWSPTDTSSYTFHNAEASGRMSYQTTTKRPYFIKGIGVLKETTMITGYSFTNRDSFNIATGTFRTYGLRRD